MPTYEYRCANGHTFEVVQRMADDPVKTCEECGAPVERVFHPVAVHFKGSGFYTTDYAGKSKSETGESKDGDSSASKDSSSKESSSPKESSAKDSSSSSPDSSKSGGEKKTKTSSSSD